uniref:Uncharacterized protein n=1 Tax=Anguilla anguilla TaxID=7936 RepID=A0A0E9PS05_ANGAN
MTSNTYIPLNFIIILVRISSPATPTNLCNTA